jgi:hypothetical protein
MAAKASSAAAAASGAAYEEQRRKRVLENLKHLEVSTPVRGPFPLLLETTDDGPIHG